jgi:hypothetical protein
MRRSSSSYVLPWDVARVLVLLVLVSSTLCACRAASPVFLSSPDVPAPVAAPTPTPTHPLATRACREEGARFSRGELVLGQHDPGVVLSCDLDSHTCLFHPDRYPDCPRCTLEVPTEELNRKCVLAISTPVPQSILDIIGAPNDRP